ncbi:hypothetical protein IHE45_20G014700 [Dioscorea alata]|uniref:Uncharacterized protein n=1 Tax=Dioscorea alata TaxID=55571 RepID=A0ACB7TSG2_DIOAL|nr:hypothetical protein IHE45_20G014700 [Dioscorea alata]
MTTGRINQVAPSRATAGGRAPVAATHRTPGHWDRGVSEGRSGGRRRGTRDGRVLRVSREIGDDGEGRRPPRVRSKWASNPRALPANHPRVDGGRANRRGRSGNEQHCRRKAEPPGGDRTLYRRGRCSRWAAGNGTQATGLAQGSGADGGPNEGAAPRRSDAERRRARRGQPVRDHSRADTVTRRARLTALPQRPASKPPLGGRQWAATRVGTEARHEGSAERVHEGI